MPAPVTPSAPERAEPQPVPEPPAPEPHNFLVVLLDDVGIEQLRAYDDANLYRSAGNDYPYAHTPTIDRLAATGVRFDQTRAHPICSPSRAALHSGSYGLRNGCRTVVRGPAQRVDASFEFSVAPQPDFVTLAELLGPRGYATGLFGKLHLGLELDDCGPGCGTGDGYAVSVLGYDVFRGVPRNANTPPVPPRDPCTVHEREVAFTNYYWIEADASGSTRTIVEGPAEDPCHGLYLTEMERVRAQNWLLLQASEPFLAVWCTSDVHGPFQWPPAQGSRALHGFGDVPPDGDGRRRFGNTRGRAKLEYVDGALGRLLRNIPPDVRARTTIFLLADNGTQNTFNNVLPEEVRYPIGHPRHRPGDEARGFSMEPYDPEHMKGSSYEQGVRVPLIVSGAGVSGPGRTSNALVDITDVFETIHELVSDPSDYEPIAPDSVSFAGILRGEPDAGHARRTSHGAHVEPNGVDEPIETEASYFLRLDDLGQAWKIVRQRDAGSETSHDEFYAIDDDPLEATDLGTGHPEYEATRLAYEDLRGAVPVGVEAAAGAGGTTPRGRAVHAADDD